MEQAYVHLCGLNENSPGIYPDAIPAKHSPWLDDMHAQIDALAAHISEEQVAKALVAAIDRRFGELSSSPLGMRSIAQAKLQIKGVIAGLRGGAQSADSFPSFAHAALADRDGEPTRGDMVARIEAAISAPPSPGKPNRGTPTLDGVARKLAAFDVLPEDIKLLRAAAHHCVTAVWKVDEPFDTFVETLAKAIRRVRAAPPSPAHILTEPPPPAERTASDASDASDDPDAPLPAEAMALFARFRRDPPPAEVASRIVVDVEPALPPVGSTAGGVSETRDDGAGVADLLRELHAILPDMAALAAEKGWDRAQIAQALGSLR